MQKEFEEKNKQIGVLITNLGTPDSPTKKDLKKYLNQFLMDRRVVDISRLLWVPLLKIIILNVRPKNSAKLYKSIWTEDGSPLLAISKKILDRLKDAFKKDRNIFFDLGMRYGNPSIDKALKQFKDKGISKIIVLPLYPQAGSPTTSSTMDAVNKFLSKQSWTPNLRFISGYHDNDNYIDSISKFIEDSFSKNGKPDKLIFSYLGMPERYLHEGDPYFCFCHKTTRLVASIAKNGTKHQQIISPGFSSDCLETLEEIDIQYRELFEEHGGEKYSYIPCLNDSDDQIKLIKNLIMNNSKGWH